MTFLPVQSTYSAAFNAIDKITQTNYYFIMKRIISILFALLLAAGLFSCATSSVSNYEEPVQTGSSVWKITKNGNTLYLGGSIHVLRESDFPLPDEFDYAFSQSDILVLETDIEQMENELVVTYLISRMFLPSGVSLHSILDAETYELLSAVCEEYGLPIETFAQMKPSMIMNILSSLQIQRYGFLQQGVDIFYLNRAKSENKPMAFLESVYDQIEMLVTMGEGYENEFVLYSLEDMENTELGLGLDLLLADWRNGTTEVVVESLIEMRDEWPNLYRSLITNRHDLWMPQLEDFIASGDVYFVVVGLLHTSGPDGLLTQLEAAGYTIEQLIL